MSDMKIKFPQCKTPLLVGPHSLRLDREQSATDAKDKEIERLRARVQQVETWCASLKMPCPDGMK